MRDKAITTFAGVLPAEESRSSLVVVVDEAVGARFSNHVPAPIFREIAEKTVRYLTQRDVLTQRGLESVRAFN